MQPLLVNNSFTGSSSVEVKVFDKESYLLPWHQHDAYELNYIVRGSGQRIIGNRVDIFQAGDILLLGPRLPHAWKEHTHQASEGIKAITLKFNKEFPATEFLGLPEFSSITRLLNQSRCAVVVPDSLKSELTQKLECLVAQTPARQLVTTLDLLLTISEHETTTLLPDDTVLYQGIESQKAKLAINHIFASYLEPLDVTTLAEISGVHPSSLGRLFKKNTGFTPTEFINQVRINHACNLLVTKELSVLEVATQSGYQNLSYFNRIFKQLKGCSPSDYKKKARRTFL